MQCVKDMIGTYYHTSPVAVENQISYIATTCKEVNEK